MKKAARWVAIGLPVTALVSLVFYKNMMSPDGPTTLSWTVPTENERNEPLTDLAGYKIHCWTATNQQINTIHVDDPATTSVVIEEIPAGTYNCAISAVNADGGQSVLSNVVATPVQ